jgi:hypothetical protein
MLRLSFILTGNFADVVTSPNHMQHQKNNSEGPLLLWSDSLCIYLIWIVMTPTIKVFASKFCEGQLVNTFKSLFTEKGLPLILLTCNQNRSYTSSGYIFQENNSKGNPEEGTLQHIQCLHSSSLGNLQLLAPCLFQQQ